MCVRAHARHLVANIGLLPLCVVTSVAMYSFNTITSQEVCRLSTGNDVCVSLVTIILPVIISYLTEEIAYVTTLYCTATLNCIHVCNYR